MSATKKVHLCFSLLMIISKSMFPIVSDWVHPAATTGPECSSIFDFTFCGKLSNVFLINTETDAPPFPNVFLANFA